MVSSFQMLMYLKAPVLRPFEKSGMACYCLDGDDKGHFFPGDPRAYNLPVQDNADPDHTATQVHCGELPFSPGGVFRCGLLLKRDDWMLE